MDPSGGGVSLLLLNRDVLRCLMGCVSVVLGGMVHAQMAALPLPMPSIPAPALRLEPVRAEPRPTVARDALLPDEQRLVSLFEAAAPAVAYITTEVVQTNAAFVREVSQGAGSGVVWDHLGHIVTNHHVISQARRVMVQLGAGPLVEGVVVGRAPEYDLAVIRLVRTPPGLLDSVRPIPLGRSAELRVGQSVLAIGNPFGLQRTLTRGIVSAVDRELATTSNREVVGVIQTDAAIHPGNSGGPLLDSAGRLVGINTAIRAAAGSVAGIGFSIPIDLINRVVPQLISYGRVPMPGIGVTPVRADLAARAGVQGVMVADVEPGSPASEAGLLGYNARSGEMGDVITAVNGYAVGSAAALTQALEALGINGVAQLTVVRQVFPDQRRERRVALRVADMRQ
jgi:2-alkenal reductase